MKITIDTEGFPEIEEEISIHKKELQSLYKGHKVKDGETIIHMLELYTVRQRSLREIMKNP